MGIEGELPVETSVRVEFRSARSELLDLALERARYEYTELADTWRLLDVKAQATSAIAGAFLAALFAFKGWEGLSSTKLASLGLVLLLIASIGCSLLAMRVTSFDMPPGGKDTFTRIKGYLDLTLDTDQLRMAKQDTNRWFLEAWIECNDRLHQCNETKADRIKCGQFLLGGAAVLTATLVTIRTFGL